MDNNEHHLVHQNLLQEVLEAGSTPCCSGGEPPSQDREAKHYQRPDGILLNDMGEGSHQNLLNQLQKDVPHHEQVSHQVPQHQLHEQVDNLPLPPEKKRKLTQTSFRDFQEGIPVTTFSQKKGLYDSIPYLLTLGGNKNRTGQQRHKQPTATCQEWSCHRANHDPLQEGQHCK